MGIAFCKTIFIGELFRHFGIYGYDFQKIFPIHGYSFRKFLRIYGWYFYDLKGTTPYLGNSSDSPGDKSKRKMSSMWPTQSMVNRLVYR